MCQNTTDIYIRAVYIRAVYIGVLLFIAVFHIICPFMNKVILRKKKYLEML